MLEPWEPETARIRCQLGSTENWMLVHREISRFIPKALRSPCSFTPPLSLAWSSLSIFVRDAE